jgi:predicted HD superfamily hydrolase involved in NAD metabolism
MTRTGSSRVRPAALLETAAAGHLPDWAVVSPRRLQHVRRVATLMADWSRALGLDPRQQTRWVAAAMLHDAMRDADPAALRALVSPALQDLPPALLHAPAAGARLRLDGVEDEALLRAITFHPIGHPDLDQLGRALYIADHIEPGRRYDPDVLAVLRARMPEAADGVLRDVLRRRIGYLLEHGRPVRPETVSFWNTTMETRASATAA